MKWVLVKILRYHVWLYERDAMIIFFFIENRDVKCFSYLSSGYYCEDGLNELPCPAGTYGNRTGAASADEGCAACPQGKDKSTEVLMYQ